MGVAPDYILVEGQTFSKAQLSLDSHVSRIRSATTVQGLNPMRRVFDAGGSMSWRIASKSDLIWPSCRATVRSSHSAWLPSVCE